MAHDGFLGGGFHALQAPWPLPLPFDAAALQAQLMSGGWEDESALSSLVSSPATTGRGGDVHEGALMEELASRLGSVCGGGLGGGGVPSPPSSRYASCYGSPVSSPASRPAPSLLAAADSMVAERAARMSCLAAAGVGPSGGKLSRVASSHSLLAEPAPADGGGVQQVPASDGSSSDAPCRKRKAPGAKGKGKDGATATALTKLPEPEKKAKKCKLSADATANQDTKPLAGEAGHAGNGKGKDVAVEPPKDYIHVRARRGQATDSHSLAERVRREKISERMKLLQDLVPGCNKVTGKAVMLDEIINYVQSLQRQVEFLSMKLSTVNPQLDFDVDNFLPKDQPSEPSLPAPLSLPPPQPPLSYSPECATPAAIGYSPSQGTAMQSVVASTKGFEMAPTFASHGIPAPSSLDAFHSANSQAGSCMQMWEDDLQSVVQMGFRGNAA